MHGSTGLLKLLVSLLCPFRRNTEQKASAGTTSTTLTTQAASTWSARSPQRCSTCWMKSASKSSCPSSHLFDRFRSSDIRFIFLQRNVRHFLPSNDKNTHPLPQAGDLCFMLFYLLLSPWLLKRFLDSFSSFFWYHSIAPNGRQGKWPAGEKDHYLVISKTLNEGNYLLLQTIWIKICTKRKKID